MRAWERCRLEGGRGRVQRFLSAAEPVHDGATLLLCLPPEVRPLAQAPGRDPDAGYQQLWSDGVLQLAPPEPELPTVHRGWLTLLDTPGETWAQSAVVFCPSEVTQAELRRRVRALLAVFDEGVGRTFGLRPTAAQMAAMLGTRHGLDMTDLPLEIETHDVLCLDELARPGLDTPASRAAHP